MAKKKPRKTPLSKKFIPQASIISDEIYAPNYSGVENFNELWCWDLTGTDNIIIDDINLSLVKIGTS